MTHRHTDRNTHMNVSLNPINIPPLPFNIVDMTRKKILFAIDIKGR